MKHGSILLIMSALFISCGAGMLTMLVIGAQNPELQIKNPKDFPSGGLAVFLSIFAAFVIFVGIALSFYVVNGAKEKCES